MKSSGLAKVGFEYVNVDDFWYQCPGSQGPNVDHYGRWVTDATKFPPAARERHPGGRRLRARLGLKFGLYVTPGISKQAVAQNTPIEGTPYTADHIAATAVETNYNCGGMVGIDYTKPGAQAFIDSWANQFASWGVDYLKIDGVGTHDIADVQAWSEALQQTGRPIHLELSNNLDIGTRAPGRSTPTAGAPAATSSATAAERQQLPADRLGQRRVPVRPGRRSGSRTAAPAPSTTTTRWRSATAATTA